MSISQGQTQTKNSHKNPSNTYIMGKRGKEHYSVNYSYHDRLIKRHMQLLLKAMIAEESNLNIVKYAPC